MKEKGYHVSLVRWQERACARHSIRVHTAVIITGSHPAAHCRGLWGLVLVRQCGVPRALLLLAAPRHHHGPRPRGALAARVHPESRARVRDLPPTQGHQSVYRCPVNDPEVALFCTQRVVGSIFGVCSVL